MRIYGFYETDLLVCMTRLISLESVTERVSGAEGGVMEGKRRSLHVNNSAGKISVETNQMAFVFQGMDTKSRKVSFMMGNKTCEGYAKMSTLINFGFARLKEKFKEGGVLLFYLFCNNSAQIYCLKITSIC